MHAVYCTCTIRELASSMHRARYARCSAGSLVILGVHRVSFPSGSDVSDHLVFRAQVNAVFDGGDAAEVEVRAFKKSINTGDETAINVGYFTLNVLQPIRAVGNGWRRQVRMRCRHVLVLQ